MKRYIAIILTFLSTAGDLQADMSSWRPQQQAEEILKVSRVKGGLVVCLGCKDPKLLAGLRANDRYLVQGLDTSVEKVKKARKAIKAKGIYGKVSVNTFDGRNLPYTDNLVNLIVVVGFGFQVSEKEIMRVLAPRGVAVWMNEDGTPKPEKVIRKTWPEDIDEWTHWLHGPDGNAVSRDRVVDAPRRMQWSANPRWSRHHNTVPSVSAQVTSNGRLFYIVDEAPASMSSDTPDKWVLVARDAFNGIELWRKPIADWGWKAWSAEWMRRFTVPTHIPSRLVAVNDKVYVTLGFNAPLSEIDAATGDVLRIFPGSDYADEILYKGGKIILALNHKAQKPGPAKGLNAPPPEHKSVAVYDAKTAKLIWKKGAYVGIQSKTGSMDRINHLAMISGDGKIFLMDKDAIVCLSLKDGRECWRVPRPEVPEYQARYNLRMSDMCTLVYHNGVLFFSQVDPAGRKLGWNGERGQIHGFDAQTGKKLWSRHCASWGWGHPADIMVRGGLAWVADFQEGPVKINEDSRNDFFVGLDSDIVYSIKPSPAILAEDDWHPQRARAEIRRVLDIGQGAQMEFIMKDISTVRYDPHRLWEWSEIAMEEVSR